MRFELEPGARRSPDGRLLSGGTPPRLLRLSAAGALTLDRILAGGLDRDGLDGAELAGGRLDRAALTLAARLAGEGTIAPLPPAPAPATTLTTVVPVRDGGAGLGPLVAALRERGEVIVVDDRSSDGSGEQAERAGATVLPNAGRPGPAGARNTGLRAARTDLVAFVDADCRVEPGWSDGLAALLAADPRLALAGPRVRSALGAPVMDRYERRRSPLDLGPDPSLVGPGRRVAYLPAAALVGRREALLAAAGGFDEALRFGEDVDLVWRLVAAGQLVRYVPAVEVEHAPRPTLPAFATQRFGYGRSAAQLEARHPGAATPLRAAPPVYLSWAAAAAGLPAAACASAFTTWRASRRSTDPASRRALAAINLRGQGQATLRLTRAMRREWLPLTTAALAFGTPRVRRAALLAVAVDALATAATGDATTGGPRRVVLDALSSTTAHGSTASNLRRAAADALDPRFAALGLLDDAAYAAGLWAGAIRAGSAAALLPRVGVRRS